ncbi:tRNA (guanosine(37)-N1)-methyltransferase TrmD [Phycisphaera mikurensis]|uniref:tRNA (guanine-N(1)-)-methyltransferase n=1 Tax=Phycisphaera mikurensis (strain NBRC 102666 / KCTC 22515 / FYK2301M01) TaxID=1142394 RepID=I0IC70_PHYMF|nr:tRNA (guanosine(37)-N1)-methyltransferase TrmD [Phycisphaera mikurensis]MBB6441923.1 tRNA (guanine37-N1)-methyltransferase [Phycisphaera mikurensis]BAM02858.1 tRNA (guanine-N(1)-)-methyltransferase [Phycisphaera mikurensis NBRC 102666]
MRIDVVTLFPEMFESVLGHSILARAARDVADPAAPDDRSRDRPAVASYHLHALRAFSEDPKHHKVDAPPYGGGPGMVMRCEPVWRAVQAATAEDPRPPHRVFLTPKGRPLTAAVAERLAGKPRLLLLCGHYEGIDERVLARMRDEPAGLDEISLGDFVLSGGELAAMTLIDAVVRLLPGVLGHADSARDDSFAAGADRLLDHPHFTKPPVWDGREAPAVLRSGDHGRIEAWRAAEALATTRRNRPDLLGGGGAADRGAPGAKIVTVREEPDESGGVRLARLVAEASGAKVGELTLEEAGLVGVATRGLGRLAGLRVLAPFAEADLAEPLAAAGLTAARACGLARLFVAAGLLSEEAAARLGFADAAAAGYTGETPLLLADLRPGRTMPTGRVAGGAPTDPS